MFPLVTKLRFGSCPSAFARGDTRQMAPMPSQWPKGVPSPQSTSSPRCVSFDRGDFRQSYMCEAGFVSGGGHVRVRFHVRHRPRPDSQGQNLAVTVLHVAATVLRAVVTVLCMPRLSYICLDCLTCGRQVLLVIVGMCGYGFPSEEGTIQNL